MRKHEVKPDAIAEALALRAAGYTTLTISQRLGISIRTLQRHFAVTRTTKGSLKQHLVEKAKEDLLAHVTSDQAIKEEAAKLVSDNLAHSLHLREIMLAASERMKADSLHDAVLVMRAAAAYSTALKNTSDVIRHSLPLERLADDELSELPELVIQELTAAEISELAIANKDPDEADSDTASDISAYDDDVIEEAPT